MVEAEALMQGIILAKDKSLQKIILETDSKGLVTELKKRNSREYKWRLMSILRDIGKLRQLIRCSKNKLISRTANHAASWIAVQSRRKMFPENWVQAPHHP